MSTKQLYTAPQRNLVLLGTALVIVGSFLPWEIQGDFVSTWRYGIQIFPNFSDNGGMLVLFLGILIIGLVFLPDGFVRNPDKWIFAAATALFIISAYHIANLLVRRVASNGVVGAPEIKIGLIVIAIGSILVLLTAIIMNLKASVHHV